jgi:hypothetical protein
MPCRPAALVAPLLVALVATAACRETAAQVVADPLGPVACFELADARGAASSMAISLCAGATSSAPGHCFVAADAYPGLTTDQMIQLCRGATSNEPLACYQRVDEIGTLTTAQAVNYCTTRCPLGPAPPEVNYAPCLAAALEQGTLTEFQARQLCQRSQSVGPVQCLVAGNAATNLTTAQLIELCTQIPACQYINVPPPS